MIIDKLKSEMTEEDFWELCYETSSEQTRGNIDRNHSIPTTKPPLRFLVPPTAYQDSRITSVAAWKRHAGKVKNYVLLLGTFSSGVAFYGIFHAHDLPAWSFAPPLFGALLSVAIRYLYLGNVDAPEFEPLGTQAERCKLYYRGQHRQPMTRLYTEIEDELVGHNSPLANLKSKAASTARELELAIQKVEETYEKSRVKNKQSSAQILEAKKLLGRLRGKVDKLDKSMADLKAYINAEKERALCWVIDMETSHSLSKLNKLVKSIEAPDVEPEFMATFFVAQDALKNAGQVFEFAWERCVVDLATDLPEKDETASAEYMEGLLSAIYNQLPLASSFKLLSAPLVDVELAKEIDGLANDVESAT